MKIAVTVSEKAAASVQEEARERAVALGFPYVERHCSLDRLCRESGMDAFLVYSHSGPVLWSGGKSYAYHLNMAKLRILRLRDSGKDRLCSLLPEKRPLSVLDATFGMGSDAAVLSWYLGGEGTVTSLEAEPVLWEIGHFGISCFSDSDGKITAALRRIRLLHADFRDFLKTAPDRSYDVIFFDPMFRKPVAKSGNMDIFREAALHEPLTEDVLKEAMRAAARRVIVKERPFSALFRSPLFSRIDGKRGQTVAYGVIEL